MAIENLSTGFGYSKKSVCAYIASLNQEFSQRLLDKDAQYHATIQSLEARVAALQAENEVLRSKEQAISSAILDVQTYAQQLRSRADSEHTQPEEAFRQQMLREQERLDAVRENVNALRAELQRILTDIDAQAAAFSIKCEEATDAVPTTEEAAAHEETSENT